MSEIKKFKVWIPFSEQLLGEEMIPLGNWADRIDELESDNSSLEEENEALNTEIADLLFEVDHLRDKKTELELDVEGLLELVGYWQGKAVELEGDREAIRALVKGLVQENDELRAGRSELDLQLEVARSGKAFWMNAANRSTDEFVKVTKELTELKAALRTLGGEKES